MLGYSGTPIDHDVGKFRRICTLALEKEWEQEKIKAKISCLCSIKTFAYKERIILAITPDDLETDVDNLGMKYDMYDCQMVLAAYKETRRFIKVEEDDIETEDDDLVTPVELINKPISHWPKAPMYAAIDVSLTDPQMSALICGRCEEGVRFKCTDFDITGARHAVALQRLVDRISGRGITCDHPLDTVLRSIFFGELSVSLEANRLEHSAFPIVSALNPSQIRAMHTAISSRVSACIGPPATGKTKTLAETILTLHRMRPDEKIIVVAVTHVAVDEVLRKVQSLCTTPEERNNITRYYSTGRIDNDIAFEQIDPEFLPEGHIESRRLQLLRSGKYSQGDINFYERGLSFLKRKGGSIIKRMREQNSPPTKKEIIENWSEDQWDSWSLLRQRLTEEVLDNTKILFSTSSSVQGKGIVRKLRFSQTVWPATTCFFDEAGCAKAVDIMQPLLIMGETLKRVMFCGDNQQLGPTLFSDAGKAAFSHPTWFSRLVRGPFPVNTLQYQYRSHDELYRPTNVVFYQGQVQAEHLTDKPRPFLQDMLNVLPLSFTANDKDFSILSWNGFVDVEEGVAVNNDGGSSSNELEAEAISSLVKVLLSTSAVTMKDIAVITGYRAQVKLLKGLAVRDGWAGVPITDLVKNPESTDTLSAATSPPLIRTIDSSQGAEYPIVILSLVRTYGDPGFMGELERANVSTSRAMEGIYFVGKYEFWSNERYNAGHVDIKQGGGKINWMARVIKAHEVANEASGKGTFVRQGRATKRNGRGFSATAVEKETEANGDALRDAKVTLDQGIVKKESLENRNPLQEEDIVEDLAQLSM